MNLPKINSSANQFVFEKIELHYRAGMPLHGYRLNDTAVEVLRYHLAEALRRRRLGDYAACFVLWAAEKFRRDYDGGQYTWAFLTEPLHAEIDLQDLYLVVRRGMAWFERPLTKAEHGATYYLKTLAAEGGLPEALLADPDGSARRLVRGLLADIDKVGSGAPEDVLNALTIQRARVLPLGFQTGEFRTLLLELCLALLERKAEIPPTIPPEARQSWLDANRPGWKDTLPLRLESAAAHSLLLEAVRTETVSGRDSIASRLLVRVEDSWVPKVSISQAAEVPDWMMGANDPNVRSLRLMPDTDLSQYAPGLVMSAYKGNGSLIWEVNRDSSGRRAEFTMPLDAAVAFRLLAEGKPIGLHVPPGCHAVTKDDFPTVWTAEELNVDGAAERLRKLGSSSLRTRASNLWVLAPPGVVTFDELDAVQDGRVGTSSLWRVSGRGFVIGDGWRLSIATAAEEDTTDSLVARGPTVPGLRDAQRAEFIMGIPAFHALNVDGTGRRLASSSLRWRAVGQRIWRNGLPAPDICLGTYQFSWKDDSGASRAFTTVRLVPERSNIELADCGDGYFECRVSDLPKGTMISLGQGATGVVPSSGSLALRVADTLATMGRVPLHIRPPEGGARAFDVTLPRPGDHGHFADGEDRLLREDYELDLGGLRGWRILAPTGRSAVLQIRLYGENAPQRPLILDVANETSLSSLLPRLRGMMAIGGPDSELRLRVLVGASQSRRIKLRRQLRDGIWQGTALSLGPDEETVDADGLEADVVNLSAPSLSARINQVHPGEDVMARLPDHAGPWMIFARDSEGLVRPPPPMVKELDGHAVAAPQFSEPFLACGAPHKRSQRVTAFGTVLRGLLSPLGSGDLGLYELQLDELADGESLSSLDSVVALSTAPELAALLLLRASPETFTARLELESVSPFSWTTLPLTAWTKALSTHEATLFLQLCANGLPENDARKYTQQAISHRLRQITDRRPEIAGQIIFAASQAGLSEALFDLYAPPAGLANPSKKLVATAQEAIKKHEAARQPFDLRSEYAPSAFNAFHEPMRGLLDAPLVAAEHALGLRSQPPNTETAIALLHYRLQDLDYFETAMPAAIVYIYNQTK